MCVLVYTPDSLSFHPLMDTYIFVIETTGGQGPLVCVCVHNPRFLYPHSPPRRCFVTEDKNKVAGHRWAAEILVGNTCPFAGLLLEAPVLKPTSGFLQRRAREQKPTPEFQGLSWNSSCHLPNMWVSWTSCLLLSSPLAGSSCGKSRLHGSPFAWRQTVPQARPYQAQ